MHAINCQSKHRKMTPKSTVVFALLAVLGTTACEERISVRGNIPHANDIAKIKKGFHKKGDIENLLGTPSAVSTFQKETWYYIGGRVKTVSFFKPEFFDRKVVVVRFDDKGLVDAIESKDVPSDEDIELVARETPTKGRELTIIQQLIGNVGRFSTPQRDSDIGP